MDKRSIIIAPNEDGFGTSAWAVLLAKEFARQAPGAEVKVLISDDKWRAFHHDKYPPGSGVSPVVLPGIPNPIAVAKRSDGTVDAAATVRAAVLPYPASRNAYETALSGAEILAGAGTIIDLGVPQLVRAAYGENQARRRTGRPPIGVVTVFDHAWSLTLARIAHSDPGLARSDAAIAGALADMRHDEALAQRAILFGEPICPRDYTGYWRTTLGALPKELPGCLGGALVTLAYTGDPDLAAFSAATASGGEVPVEARARARRDVRRLLGLPDEEPALFVTGGGTAVWDDVLGALLDDYARRPPPYRVVVYSPAEAARRGVRLVPVEVQVNGRTLQMTRATWGKADRITFVGPLAGETHHPLFAAFDLVLTRAGGGTVNNALAFRVPLVLVEETGMWQVEQIRQACGRMGLAELASLETFRAAGRACVETPDGQLKKMPGCAANMSHIPAHGEMWLCRELNIA